MAAIRIDGMTAVGQKVTRIVVKQTASFDVPTEEGEEKEKLDFIYQTPVTIHASQIYKEDAIPDFEPFKWWIVTIDGVPYTPYITERCKDIIIKRVTNIIERASEHAEKGMIHIDLLPLFEKHEILTIPIEFAK